MFLAKAWHGLTRLMSRRGSQGQQRQRRPARRLCLEPLEDRNLLSSYTITDLGTLGGPTSVAFGLNSGGQVVGLADTQQKTGYKVPLDRPHNSFHVNDYTSQAFVWTPATANGTSGTMIDIDPNPTGTADSFATDINSIGQVTGSYFNGGFLWEGGIFENLGTLGAGASEGINNAGQIVGEMITVPHAFLYSGGTVQDLDSGSANESWAYALNDAGQVVGARGGTAFLYSGGSFQSLGSLPGDVASVAYDINDASASHPVEVVGVTINNHAFVWDSEHGIQGLDSLAANYSSNANGINASGQIVGYSGASAVLWQPNPATGGYVLTDLNSLIPSNSGWSLYRAYAINDMGQIVGYGVLKNSKVHAFLLTPTTTTALVQPTASTLATTTRGLVASTGEEGAASFDFIFAIAALATPAQTASPVGGAIAATVLSAPIPMATAPGPASGLGMAALSFAGHAASNGSAAIDQVFAEFGGRFPDCFDIDRGWGR